MEALAALSDEECAALLYDWPTRARPSQLEPEGDWVIWLVLAGRGYGKTRVGAEWTREQTRNFEFVNMIGATFSDIRDIMVEGESGIMACCPPWDRPTFRPALQRLDWPNGAKSLYFTAEQPDRLRGKQHERLWMDELAAWQYVDDTFDMAVLGLRLGDDPRACITSTPKPIPLLRELIARENVVITKGTTYENRDNLAPTFFSQLITKYEGTRLGRQELEAELLLDEGLAYRVTQGVHIIPPFLVPTWWDRFEAMDYGSTNPTAWGAFAVDDEQNVIVFDMYYKPGLVSEHANAILDLRRKWRSSVCFAPTDIKLSWPGRSLTGKEMTIETEFAEHGITFRTAQNDRRAGYQRTSEMLRCDDARRFPVFHPRPGEKGSPRLFIMDTDALAPLIQQLRDAPLESAESPLSRFPGEAVDKEWESPKGHAHAMLRYGLMSRPGGSVRPYVPLPDPRAEIMRQVERRRSQPSSGKADYDA